MYILIPVRDMQSLAMTGSGLFMLKRPIMTHINPKKTLRFIFPIKKAGFGSLLASLYTLIIVNQDIFAMPMTCANFC